MLLQRFHMNMLQCWQCGWSFLLPDRIISMVHVPSLIVCVLSAKQTEKWLWKSHTKQWKAAQQQINNVWITISLLFCTWLDHQILGGLERNNSESVQQILKCIWKTSQLTLKKWSYAAVQGGVQWPIIVGLYPEGGHHDLIKQPCLTALYCCCIWL